MKILRIVLLFLSAAALPRFFNNHKWKNIGTIGNRGPGMTVASIRSYFNEQRLRQRQHARAQSNTRVNKILDTYFQIRDGR